MKSDWQKVKLADYCDKIGSGATPRGGSKVYLDAGEIALVRSQNVYNHGFDYDGLVYIDEKAAKKLSNVALQENDVLINITGDSVARVCMVPDDVLPARVNQHVSILRPKNGSLDPRFLRYSLVNYENQYKLLAIASAGGTRKAITKGHLEQFEISLPDIDYQKEISDILSTLDQKIHLNQQTNETLESMAQAIFKSWFVDFDPVRAKMEAQSAGRDPIRAAMAVIAGISLEQDQDEVEAALDQKLAGMTEAQQQQLHHTAELFPDELAESELGEVPKGWQVKPFYDTIEIIGGGTPKTKRVDYWDGDILWYSVVDAPTESDVFAIDTEKKITNAGLENSSAKLVSEGTTIISARGTVGKLALTPKPMTYNQSCYGLRSKNDFPYYNFYKTKQLVESLKRGSHGSVFDTITQKTFKTIDIVQPDEKIESRFEEAVGGIMNKVQINLEENFTITQLRDTLLPKLISGEVELNKNPNND